VAARKGAVAHPDAADYGAFLGGKGTHADNCKLRGT
jgi:hypothetical protein